MTKKKTKEATDAVSTLIQAMDKQFGEGMVMKMGSSWSSDGVPVTPSGSITLDDALGVGGYPKGRLVEIYGPESSGKTTLALHAICEAQRAGGICAFVDAEHALDVHYAAKLGVDVDNLLVSQPDCGEQALEITNALVQSGDVDLVVIDSVAALVPRAELDRARQPAGIDDRLYQPDAAEDRSDLWQSGDHHRWKRSQILRLRADRCAADWGDQERRGPHRIPHPGEGRQEQDGAAVSAGGV